MAAVDERGQLLLSTAFALAVLFVGLALVLNTAIFTSNLGTQGSDAVSGHHALQVRADAQRGAAGLIERVNDEETGSYGALVSNLTTDLDRWGELIGRHESLGGGTAAVTLRETTNGSLLRQTADTRAFTNASGAADWTLVAGASGLRGVELTVASNSLVDPPSAADTGPELAASGVFRIVVTADDGDRWRVFVYGDAGDAAVAVENPDGRLASACSGPPESNGTVRIDWPAATVGGESCSALRPLSSIASDPTVAYRDGNNATGTYAMVVERPVSEVADDDYGPAGATTAPYVTEAIYDATIGLEYTTPTLAYRTNVSVTPGGHHG